MPPILIERDAAAYIPIEKVACSSIKWALGHYLGVAQRGMPHNWPFRWIRQPELAERPDLYRFAFVRNPFDRLLSCWTHKVLRYRGRRSTCPLWPSLATDTPFPEFAAWAAEQDPLRCNWHFRPQWTFLEWAGRPLIYALYRFESLAEDWAALQRLYGWPDLPHRNATEHGDYREAFTPAARAAAERFYRRDLDLLGYDFSDASASATVAAAVDSPLAACR